MSEESAGQRLDNFLLACLKGVPRSHVYRLIRSGQVRVNSGRAAPMRRLQAGDRVRLPPVEQRAVRIAVPAGARLGWLAQRIIFEDSRLLVLDKPPGLAVHGGSGINLACIEALRTVRPELRALELVHRLDRATSGCLLVAKRRSALRLLHQLLREGGMEKRYLALVRGRWRRGDVDIDMPLATRRLPSGEARVKVDSAGKEARSRFKALEHYGSLATFMDVSIATGRTHQIRVHAAHAQHPVAGDERYGDAEFNAAAARFGLQRMFLHAHAVAFRWPDTAEPFSVSAPLPDDLRAVLDALQEKHPARG